MSAHALPVLILQPDAHLAYSIFRETSERVSAADTDPGVFFILLRWAGRVQGKHGKQGADQAEKRQAFESGLDPGTINKINVRNCRFCK